MGIIDLSDREFDHLDEVRSFLEEEAGGVATFRSWQLRDAIGYSRLGSNVVSEISEELDRRGIGHVPAKLGLNQYDEARLYLRSSPIGKFLDMASKPGYSGDAELRNALSDGSREILEKIKRMLN